MRDPVPASPPFPATGTRPPHGRALGRHNERHDERHNERHNERREERHDERHDERDPRRADGFLRSSRPLAPNPFARHPTAAMRRSPPMRVTIRRIGNSEGVILPQAMLAQAGITDEAEMAVEKGTIVLRKPRRGLRAGWAEAARRLAEAGDDAIVWPGTGAAPAPRHP